VAGGLYVERSSVPPLLCDGYPEDIIVVCVLPDECEGAPIPKRLTFSNDLPRMRGWLKQLKVTEIAMNRRAFTGARMDRREDHSFGCCY
jgi:hypothetical protein